jgi:hypothetical protein
VALAPDARKHWIEMSQRKATAAADRRRLRDLDKAARREKDCDAKKRAEAEWLALKTKIEQRDADTGAEVSVLMPLAGYEAIPVGTHLAHDFTLLRVLECEVGLFLLALDRLAQNPILGAHSNHGCGIVSGTWNVAMRVGDLGRYENIGEIAMKPFSGIEVPERLATMQQTFTTPLSAGEFDFRAPPTRRPRAH